MTVSDGHTADGIRINAIFRGLARSGASAADMERVLLCSLGGLERHLLADISTSAQEIMTAASKNGAAGVRVILARLSEDIQSTFLGELSAQALAIPHADGSRIEPLQRPATVSRNDRE